MNEFRWIAAVALLGMACEVPGGSPADAAMFDAGHDAGCEVETREVAIEGRFGLLAGTLERPAACGPVPLVLLYSGSGTTDRDGNAGLTGPASYRALALALRDIGIASLRYDDHGAAGSAGALPADPRDFDYDDEVADAAAWAMTFQSDPEVSHLFVAGHSQGSLTAALVARAVPVDGVISLAGTSLPAGQLLITQTPSSASDEEEQAVIDTVAALEAGHEVDPETLPPRVASIFPTFLQPYLIAWFAHDPTAIYTALETPTLFAHGDTDTLVPPSHSIALSEVAVDATYVEIANMAHSLKHATDDLASQQAARTDPSVPLGAGLVDAIPRVGREP